MAIATKPIFSILGSRDLNDAVVHRRLEVSSAHLNDALARIYAEQCDLSYEDADAALDALNPRDWHLLHSAEGWRHLIARASGGTIIAQVSVQ